MHRPALIRTLAVAFVILMPMELAHCAWMSLRAVPPASVHPRVVVHAADRDGACCDERGAAPARHDPLRNADACACLRLPPAQVPAAVVVPHSSQPIAALDETDLLRSTQIGSTTLAWRKDLPPPRGELPRSGFPRSPPPSA